MLVGRWESSRIILDVLQLFTSVHRPHPPCFPAPPLMSPPPPIPQKTERHIYLVLEYCAGGDLRALIRKEGRLAEPSARHFMRDLGACLLVLYFAFFFSRGL